MKDLVVLSACKEIELTLRRLLERHRAFGLGPISFDLFGHPYRDSGCYAKAHDFLRPFIRQYRAALVVFDHHGCGGESKSPEVVEREVEERLSINGWEDRSHVLVIAPELEAWVWSDSPHVVEILGWRDSAERLRQYLRTEDLWPEADEKPPDPKAALQSVLKKTGKRRSPALYDQLAETVAFASCRDASFLRLKSILAEIIGNP